MERSPIPSLTDGVIQLRPLTQADAAAHLAGEDEEMAKWLSGGRSTAATVQTAIDKFEEQWRTGGPRRAFGVFDCSNDQLIGFVEANLELLGNSAEVNVSYGIFFHGEDGDSPGVPSTSWPNIFAAPRRREGSSCRSAPENGRSIRVAERAGFARVGVHEVAEGQRVRYVRK